MQANCHHSNFSENAPKRADGEVVILYITTKNGQQRNFAHFSDKNNWFVVAIPPMIVRWIKMSLEML